MRRQFLAMQHAAGETRPAAFCRRINRLAIRGLTDETEDQRQRDQHSNPTARALRGSSIGLRPLQTVNACSLAELMLFLFDLLTALRSPPRRRSKLVFRPGSPRILRCDTMSSSRGAKYAKCSTHYAVKDSRWEWSRTARRNSARAPPPALASHSCGHPGPTSRLLQARSQTLQYAACRTARGGKLLPVRHRLRL